MSKEQLLVDVRFMLIDVKSRLATSDEYKSVVSEKIAALSDLIAELRAAGESQPVAWRITDGEGGFCLYDDPPSLLDLDWADRYGRSYEPLYSAPSPAKPRQPIDDGRLWSFLRSVMAQGIDIRADHTEYELFSARMDAAAAERVESLRNLIAKPERAK